MRDVVRAVLTALGGHSLVSVLGTLLTDSYFAGCATRAEFLREWNSFLLFAHGCPLLSTDTVQFCSQVHTQALATEIANLANRESGWHFSAKNAKAEQVEAFSLTDMSSILETKAPLSWSLLSTLLQSDNSRLRRRLKALGLHTTQGGSEGVWDDEDEYWESLGIVDEEIEEQGDEGRRTKRRRRAGDRYTALLRIVSLFLPVISFSLIYMIETCRDHVDIASEH